jgi:hypothetical protein
MKRINMTVIVALILGLLAHAHSQTPKSNTQKPEPQAETATAKRTVLVKQLPASVEGVSLKGSQVKLKPGYKFVKEPNNTISVARMNGTGIGGTWKCECSNNGACGVSISPITGLDCLTESCTGTCTLKVTVGDKATAVLMSKSQNLIRHK